MIFEYDWDAKYWLEEQGYSEDCNGLWTSSSTSLIIRITPLNNYWITLVVATNPITATS